METEKALDFLAHEHHNTRHLAQSQTWRWDPVGLYLWLVSIVSASLVSHFQLLLLVLQELHISWLAVAGLNLRTKLRRWARSRGGGRQSPDCGS
jgi:hypothetical protein